MVKVIDVFAGPGGLNEGFSRFRDGTGEQVFKIAGSFEVDEKAVDTLRFRAAAREVGLLEHPAYLNFMNGRITRPALLLDDKFSAALVKAEEHVFKIRLGEATRSESDSLIRGKVDGEEPWILIGGPPCQAYSLVGRSRMGSTSEKFLQDERHFLFREYLHILREHRPTVFVMENVKGLLSATHRETRMFARIMEDLRCDGAYEIRSLVVPDSDPAPRDFVIRSEEFGIPQKRHRVILLGIRADAGLKGYRPLARAASPVTLRDAIGHDLPLLRSRVSPARHDADHVWEKARAQGTAHAQLQLNADVYLGGGVPPSYDGPAKYRARRRESVLTEWLRRDRLERVTLHEPRSHMPADLARYAYLTHMAAQGLHPKVKEMPRELWPNHRNLMSDDTPFVDRFKVQPWDAPSSTIVSHISKDGHHFIHPDPWQMRSLTVREAARLQTFPDDYHFEGNRTQQYHQVGNAVPPLLAVQIAAVVAELLGR